MICNWNSQKKHFISFYKIPAQQILTKYALLFLLLSTFSNIKWLLSWFEIWSEQKWKQKILIGKKQQKNKMKWIYFLFSKLKIIEDQHQIKLIIFLSVQGKQKINLYIINLRIKLIGYPAAHPLVKLWVFTKRSVSKSSTSKSPIENYTLLKVAKLAISLTIKRWQKSILRRTLCHHKLLRVGINYFTVHRIITLES